MSQSKIVGVVDEPISTGKSDALKIGLHSHALVNFIKNTLIDLARDYEKDTGKKLKSAKGYAG